MQIILFVSLFNVSATFSFPLKDGLKISEEDERNFIIPFQNLDLFLPDIKRQDARYESYLRAQNYVLNPQSLLDTYKTYFQGKKLNSIQYPPIGLKETTPNLVSLITCCAHGYDRILYLLQKTYQIDHQLEDIQRISIIIDDQTYSFGASFLVFQKMIMGLLSHLHYQKNITLCHPIGVVQTEDWQSANFHLTYFWDDHGIVPFVSEKGVLSQTGIRYSEMPFLNIVTNGEGNIIAGPALFLRRANETYTGVRIDLIPPKPNGKNVKIVSKQSFSATNFDEGIEFYKSLHAEPDSAILIHDSSLLHKRLPEVEDGQAAIVYFPQSDEEFIDQFIECMIEEINAIDYQRRDMILPLIEILDLPAIEYRSLYEEDQSADLDVPEISESQKAQFQIDKENILSAVEERRRQLLENIISTANPEKDMKRRQASEKKNKKHNTRSRGGQHKKRGGGSLLEGALRQQWPVRVQLQQLNWKVMLKSG